MKMKQPLQPIVEPRTETTPEPKKELTLADLRRMGGQAVFKKYGNAHFSKLGKRSAKAKAKARKEAARLASKTPKLASV